MNAMIGVAPYVTFVAYTVFLLGVHVHLDREKLSEHASTLWDRLQEGPEALNGLDKVLFGVLILLAFELLDFITNHSGSKYFILCDRGRVFRDYMSFCVVLTFRSLL
jgi:hypothetical protein